MKSNRKALILADVIIIISIILIVVAIIIGMAARYDPTTPAPTKGNIESIEVSQNKSVLNKDHFPFTIIEDGTHKFYVFLNKHNNNFFVIEVHD